VPFIMACCVLHNLAKLLNMPVPPQRLDDNEKEDSSEGDSSSGGEESSSDEDDEGPEGGQDVAKTFAGRYFGDE